MKSLKNELFREAKDTRYIVCRTENFILGEQENQKVPELKVNLLTIQKEDENKILEMKIKKWKSNFIQE